MHTFNPKWINYKASGTYVLATTPAKLEKIIINTTSTGSITIYDGPQASGSPTVATIKASVGEGTFDYGISTNVGLCLVLAGNSDITVIYR